MMIQVRVKMAEEGLEYLAGHTTFQQDGGILIDELQLLEHPNPLLVIRNEFQILVRDRHF
jgi:hypothetical protein